MRLIGRDWYKLSDWNLTVDGCCGQCGATCAGVFEVGPGSWGQRRLPVNWNRLPDSLKRV